MRSSYHRVGAVVACATILASVLVSVASAQMRPVVDTVAASRDSAAPPLDSLVRYALAASPRVRGARARVTAARTRVAPAGVRPDPMLMAGVQNLPVREPGFSDFMTMKMIGISQTLPARGKLGLQRRAAAREADGASWTLADVGRRVAYDVRAAYYELVFVDRALENVRRNQALLGDLLRLTETKYRVGTVAQSDVLKARTEAVRLAETAVTLATQRHTTLARLNAILGRASDTPVERPELPESLVRAAVPDSARRVEFVSPALGALASGSPLPSLDSLQALALAGSAALGAHSAMVAAQAARVALARKAAVPDVDVSLQYGQRQAESDMVSAVVSIPLPLHRRRNQDALAASAGAELLALDAEHEQMQDELRAEVAEDYEDAERARTQLALYATAILPQSRAALESAMASYQVGRTDLLSVLDTQGTLFATETEYFRALTDFATAVARLERVVGREILS